MLHKIFPIGGAMVVAVILAPVLGFAAPAVPAPSESVKDERPAKEAEISNETPMPGVHSPKCVSL